MASTPGRQRGSRPQVQNEIGTYGRTTGIKPPDPKKVHRDSNGLENPNDFFTRAEGDYDSSSASSAAEASDSDELSRVVSPNSTTKSNKNKKKSRQSTVDRGGRRGERPDKFIPGEGRGRKTGAIVAEGRRDSDGFEDPNQLFQAFSSSSPPGSISGATTTQSTIGRRGNTISTAQSSVAGGTSVRSQRSMNFYQREEDEFEEGDTTTLSPTKYQQRTQTLSASASQTTTTTGNRKPSSLRQSTTHHDQSSPHESVSSSSKRRRKSSRQSESQSESETETEEDTTTPRKNNDKHSTRRRRFSSLNGEKEPVEEDEEEEVENERGEEPLVEEFDLASSDIGGGDTTMGDIRSIQGEVMNESEQDEEEEEEVVQTGKQKNSRKSLGKVKSIVDNKGKGKGRAVSESDEEEEEDRTSRKKSRKSRVSDLSTATTSTRRESRGSNSGGELVKLGKNGKEIPAVVDRKGKGKEVVRSPTPPQAEEDNYDDYDNDNFDRGDFGGGDEEDDEEARNFNPGIDYDDQDDEPLPQAEDEQPEEDEDEEAEEVQPTASTSKSKQKQKQKEKEKEKKSSKQPKKVVKPAIPTKTNGRGKKRSSDDDSDGSNASDRTVTAKRARKATTPGGQERIIEQVPRDRQIGSVDVDGVRRSNRQKLPPLDYWRNERVVYKKRSSGVVAMTAIIRVPKEEPEPLTQVGRKKRSKSTAPRSKGRGARSVKTESDTEEEEERVDSMTDPDGLVWSWEGNAETTRRIAFTENMMDPKPAFNNQYQFQKIYQELDYLAGGILDIPVGGKKDTKPAKDNSYLFYCAKGSVSVLCHRTRVAIGKGGTFFIPRGNSYSIEATSNKPVRLFFAQGRRVIELEDGTTRPDTQEASQQVRDAQEQALREQEEAQNDTGSEQPGSEEEEEEEEED